MRLYNVSDPAFLAGYPYRVKELAALAENYSWTDEELESVLDLQLNQSVKILDHTILRVE